MKKNIFLIFTTLLFLKSYTQENTNLSNSEKIFGLSKIWSEVNSNFVFYNKIQKNWDSLYVSYIKKIQKSKNNTEYYYLLKSFISNLNDGHSSVWFPDYYYDDLEFSPIETKLIENKIVVTKIFKECNCKIDIGDEIIEINGEDAIDYGNLKIGKYGSFSTKQSYNYAVFSKYLLRGKTYKLFNLKIKNHKTGEIYTTKIQPKEIKYRKENYEFESISNKIAYLNINSFYSNNYKKLFLESFKKFKSYSNLIIDLRENEGGSSSQAYFVLKYLLKKSFLTSKWRTRQNISAYKSWGQTESYLSTEPELKSIVSNSYKGNIVVLTSAKTFSAAEDFLISFDYSKRGIIVGQKTGGSTGNPIEYNLPGGGGFKICSKEDTYPNGKIMVGIGIIPNIEVKEKLKNIIKKEDVVLKKAIEYLNNNS